MTASKETASRGERDFALAMRQVSKTFRSESGGEVHALDEVDLTVQKGDFVVLIGPTGCGKTTLLNILGGLDRQDGGEVRLGADVNQDSPVSYVFQHYTLFPWRTLIRNVTFGLEMRAVRHTTRVASARRLLAAVGLSHFENAYPHELSGGMRQRAAIAQALAVQPKILLMDEPFGALDDATRKDLQQLLVDLWQNSGTTLLFVTHNIDEAVLMASKIVIFSKRPGRIVSEIPVDLPRPRDTLSDQFTRKFVEVRQTLYSGTGRE